MNTAHNLLGKHIGPYEIENIVGKGTFGVVYRAAYQGKHFAIKMVDASNSGNQMVNFNREASSLARIRSAGLPKIYDFGMHEDSTFIVMDYIDGKTLKDHLAAGPMSAQEVVRMGVSLAETLASIHSKGILHKDIKSDNVMIGRDKRVFLIDFGLAVERSFDADAAHARAVGTLAYCSPEQLGATASTVDERSDLYSLGVVLYEALAGTVPFEASNVNELLRLQTSQRPAAIQSQTGERTRAMAAIVEKLLEKKPENRYQSAVGLLSDLRRYSDLEMLAETGKALELGQFDKIQGLTDANSLPLVGRASELARLNSAWKSCQPGHLNIRLISGEPGQGKTRLAREFLNGVEKNNVIVFFHKCNPIETSKPLAPVVNALDQLAELFSLESGTGSSLSSRKFSESIGDAGEILGSLSPKLKKILGADAGVGSGKQSLDINRFSNKLVDVIARIAQLKGGLIFWIDDIQWIDPASLKLFSRLVQNHKNEPIFFLLTARSDAESREFVSKFIEELSIGDREIVEVNALDRASTKKIIELSLGTTDIADALNEKLFSLSHGNAFFLNEYLSSFLSAGCLKLVSSTWTLDLEILERATISENVFDLIQSKIKGLAEATQDYLRYAALVGNKFWARDLSRLLQLPEKSIDELLLPAARMGLVEPLGRGYYAFVHDRIRESLEKGLSESDRRRRYQSIAEAFPLTDELLNSDAVYDVAAYYSNGLPGKNPELVFQVNSRAAQRASLALSPQSAIVYLKRAELEMESNPERVSATLEYWKSYASTCFTLGNTSKAFQCIEEALSLSPDHEDQSELLILKSLSLSTEGRLSESFEVFKQVLQILKSPYPRGRVRFAGNWMLMMVLSNFLALTGISKGLYKFRIFEKRRRRHQLLNKAYENTKLTCYPLGIPLDLSYIVLRQYYHAHLLGDSPELAMGHVGMFFMWGIFRSRRMVLFHLNKATRIAERLHDPITRTAVRGTSGTAFQFLGDHQRAVKLSLEGLKAAHKYHSAYIQSIRAADLAYQFSATGHFKESLELLEKYIPMMDELRNFTYMITLRGMAYLEYTVVGNSDRADQIYQQWIQLVKKADPSMKLCTQNFPAYSIAVAYEVGEITEDTEQLIEQFLKTNIPEFYSRFVFMYIAYSRLLLLEKDSGGASAPENLRRLNEAISGFKSKAAIDVLNCHYYVLRAAAARFEGKFASAASFLSLATDIADRCNSPFGHFKILEERAKHLRALGNEEQGRFYAVSAASLAQTHGWKVRENSVRRQFGLPLDKVMEAIPQEPVRSEIEGSGRVATNKMLDALVRVSVASSRNLDPEKQIESTLDEIISLFNADRAYIFKQSERDKGVVFAGGRSAGKITLERPSEFSRTVINSVFEKNEAVVLAGSDEMEAVGAHSAIHHGLSSIMAVPLSFKGVNKGVVYVDSRISKGIFSQKDVDFFKSIANHIAIAFENRDSFQLELERRAFLKDLEVGATVQKMLLPRLSAVKNEHFGIYAKSRSASQCGGDCWWYSIDEDSNLFLFIGDVTGHGVGPALITASISAYFNSLRSREAYASFKAHLLGLNDLIVGLTREEYMVSGLALEFNPKTRVLKTYNFGSHGFFLMNGMDGFSVEVAKGSVLGLPNCSPGEAIFEIKAKSKILIYTDGISEMQTTRGRFLGDRHLLKLFKSLAAGSPKDVVEGILRDADEHRGELTQEDDIIVVCVELP